MTSVKLTIITMLLLRAAEVNRDLEDPDLQCIAVAKSNRHTNMHDTKQKTNNMLNTALWQGIVLDEALLQFLPGKQVL